MKRLLGIFAALFLVTACVTPGGTQKDGEKKEPNTYLRSPR